MISQRIVLAGLLAAFTGPAVLAQARSDGSVAGQDRESASGTASAPSARADAYFDYTMGHIFEQQYENTSKAEYASKAIDFYKKAYALDPQSPVIGERLAEMYWKAER